MGKGNKLNLNKSQTQSSFTNNEKQRKDRRTATENRYLFFLAHLWRIGMRCTDVANGSLFGIVHFPCRRVTRTFVAVFVCVIIVVRPRLMAPRSEEIPGELRCNSRDRDTRETRIGSKRGNGEIGRVNEEIRGELFTVEL